MSNKFEQHYTTNLEARKSAHEAIGKPLDQDQAVLHWREVLRELRKNAPELLRSARGFIRELMDPNSKILIELGKDGRQDIEKLSETQVFVSKLRDTTDTFHAIVSLLYEEDVRRSLSGKDHSRAWLLLNKLFDEAYQEVATSEQLVDKSILYLLEKNPALKQFAPEQYHNILFTPELKGAKAEKQLAKAAGFNIEQLPLKSLGVLMILLVFVLSQREVNQTTAEKQINEIQTIMALMGDIDLAVLPAEAIQDLTQRVSDISTELHKYGSLPNLNQQLAAFTATFESAAEKNGGG
jgi:hypothetical protein